ncbi:MAG: imelysin family protein [Polyangiales bacterium]
MLTPRLLSVSLSSLLALSACGDDSPMVQVDPDRQEFVADFVDETLMPTLETFETSARTLEDAANAYAASQNDDTRAAAQEAWRTTMNAWQHIELFLVGPAGSMTEVAGGQDIRDEVYSWPLTNRCRIDQETLEDSHADGALLQAELVNVRGLDAMEYLLFDADTENACSPISRLNMEGSWEAMRASIPERRARYAATAASLIHTSATRLIALWRDGYREELVGPGDNYGTNQEALNAITDALFYLDKEVKDMKLAGVAGVAEEIGVQTRESLDANVSIPNLRANLDAFALAFRGAEGAMGLEELLEAAGAADLASRMNAAIDAAVAELARLNPDIPTLVAADERAMLSAYERVKDITDLLKTEFIGILDLELPDRAEGDND